MKKSYRVCAGGKTYNFRSLREVMAKASPERSGDVLAGIAAADYQERVAAQMCLADVPLSAFLEEPLIPYEEDEITRLILDSHDVEAFAPVSSLTVGEFRDWLLRYETGGEVLEKLTWGLTPEMVAAVSKIMGNQDLILVASKRRVITRFRNTLGLKGRFSSRLQPNDPSDDLRSVAASILDGLMYGCGDAVIGINPATDSVPAMTEILKLIDELVHRYEIPTQSCVLSHVTNAVAAMELGAPVDLVFQSIAGTEIANKNFGINLALLGEARAYAVARKFEPLLVNTVVGFIGPEYLYDGMQIIRAGLEDHFCAKLLGLPMGCDICYTNHAEADQNDMDNLLTLLAAAGLNYIMGIPGCDDIMLGYQTTSFHDVLYARQLFGLRPAPEFEAWLEKMEIFGNNKLLPAGRNNKFLTSYESSID